ncbi:MAG: uroporphyrinogen decarboxylase [Pseudomonadota bacterium]
MAQTKLLIQALQGTLTPRVPFWFMRQAGRYLPEYRHVRASTSGFMDLCFTPDKAAAVTLQPLERFSMDGAILFSDILVIPHALGVDVTFAEGEGPLVGITDTPEKIAALNLETVRSKLAPIAETVRLVKKDLPDGVALIGFAGAPWTVACYMLQGKGGKEFLPARKFAIAQPALMQKLVDTLTEATIDYLRMQIDAGAEAVQIFDSWAGLLTPDQFALWVTAPTVKIIEALQLTHPEIPVIGFAKGASTQLSDYAKKTQANCIGVDQHTPMEYAIASRAHVFQAVQGNLDPLLVVGDKPGALRSTESILKKLVNTPAVFNLGHGFIPETPIEHVSAVSEMVRAWRR